MVQPKHQPAKIPCRQTMYKLWGGVSYASFREHILMQNPNDIVKKITANQALCTYSKHEGLVDMLTLREKN